ncbi:MAG: glycosyl hydrolase [Ruminococcus sp.]|nr:glycosyl hydrolase [Ruminococcus sp.]
MNRFIKRALAGCLAVTMTLSAAGCAGSSDSSSKGGDSGAESSQAEKPSEPVVESIGNLDLSEVTNDYDVPEDFVYECEAESGEMTGNASVLSQNFLGEFSGDGFVSVATEGDEVDFEVEFPAKGSYNIVITMAGDSEGHSNLITVDGNVNTAFKSVTTSFGENTAENVLIDEGNHTIGIKADEGHIYVDSIKIVPAPALDLTQYEVTSELSNPNASDRTKRLYNFLTDVYGKYTISGQFSGNNDGKDSREFKELDKNLGKTPVILGLDVGNLSLSGLSHGAGGGDMVPLQAIDWYTNENGIVSLCWHWLAPDDYLEANGQPWWRGFYSDSVSFDLGKAMSGEDQAGYDAIIADLDHMAEQLKIIADADVPILWRPLHEAAGDPKWNNPWFWWGSGGRDAYLELWKLMYDKFTNEYGLDNLIWVWNAQNPEWYPGDEYVDIIGYDVYPAEHDSSSQKEYYDLMKQCSPTGSKIIAMTENGALFDPDAAFNDGSRWAWFSTWNGEFTLKDMQLSDQYTTFEMWEKIYNSERVLTKDEMPDLKCYPLDTEAFLANQ